MDNRRRERLIRASIALSPKLAIASALVGLALLANYTLDSVDLVSLAPRGFAAHPWTALCLVGLGGAVWSPRPGRPHRACAVLVAIVFAVLAFRLATMMSGSDAFSIVSPFHERLGALRLAGRDISMSVQTLLMLLLIGLSLVFLHLGQITLSQGSAAMAVVIALAAHIGLLSATPQYYGWMAIPTMLGGLLAGLATLTRSAHKGPMRHLLTLHPVGGQARLQMLALTAPPIVLTLMYLWLGGDVTTRSAAIAVTLPIAIVAFALMSRAGGLERMVPLRSVPEQAKGNDARLSLDEAWDRGEIMILYQPQVALATGSIIGFEAVTRWNDPARGTISPTEFIPIAERSGLIVPLGKWILRAACRQAAQWSPESGLSKAKVSVNVSPMQLKQRGFEYVVAEILRDTGLPPDRLVLEITENLVVPDGGDSQRMLHALHDMGIRIAIDDFGTGYSSLSYLRRLPCDYLKIDQSFVSELPGDLGAAAIARAIVAMGHSLGMQVIAEGVETPEQAEFLQSVGCDEGQGYLYSPPLPAGLLSASKFHSIVADHNLALPFPDPVSPHL